jgi:cytochrome c oxidase subunit 2
MATGPNAAAPAAATDHGRRVIVAWIVLSAIATPLVAAFVGPLLPPGKGSLEASGQVLDNTVMTAAITPVFCLLVVFFAYALSQFRVRKASEALVDGPPLRQHNTIQVLWVALTTATVLFFAGFGSYQLLKDGAGGGQGPSPIAVPSDPAGQATMQVQVIGQQWNFTYRYPGYGGVETSQLVLPENTSVELHVTSLDAIHSFWAYQLGVKADANPGVDNVAYVQTRGAQSFDIHCAELCGLWHGYMFQTGHVVSQSQFAAWIEQQQTLGASIARYLPAYSTHYFPDPQRRAG